MTEPGGAAWRQTIFYPLLFASTMGRGTALDLDVDVATYDLASGPNVPWLDISGVHDSAGGIVTFFAINRNPTEAIALSLSLEGLGTARSVEHTVIRHDDLEARNTAANPDTVLPQKGQGAKLSGNKLEVSLAAHSYAVLRVKL